MPSYSFKGKKVLVTGGARGIGLGIAKSFYEEGATVYIIDKNQKLLNEVKEKLPNANTIVQDLLEFENTRKVIEGLGPLDHLVNNAGVMVCKNIVDTTLEDFDLIFGINLKSLMNCSIAFYNGIRKAQNESGGNFVNEGRTIVNISSIADQSSAAMFGIYCASKAGVTSLTKTMAREFSELNIRVNSVRPGVVRNGLVEWLDPKIAKIMLDGESKKSVLKEQIEPKDIADSVLFLSSPFSSKITGSSIKVDRGWSSN